MLSNPFILLFLIVSTFFAWGFITLGLLYAFSGAANAAKLCRWLAWHLAWTADGLDGFARALAKSKEDHKNELVKLEQQEAQA